MIINIDQFLFYRYHAVVPWFVPSDVFPGPGPVGTGCDGTLELTPALVTLGTLNVIVGSSSTGTTVPKTSCSWLGLSAILSIFQ